MAGKLADKQEANRILDEKDAKKNKGKKSKKEPYSMMQPTSDMEPSMDWGV